MQEAFDEIDVKVNWIGMSDKNIFDMLKTMKKEFEAHPIDALVWISVALYMPFAFGMRLARKQIWWAMKYHSINLPTIDGYVTGYSISRQKIIDGKSWRTSCYGVKDWFDPNVTQQALRIKKEFGAGKTILGSFGREEKLNNKNFIESVCNILIETRTLYFSGREERNFSL